MAMTQQERDDLISKARAAAASFRDAQAAKLSANKQATEGAQLRLNLENSAPKQSVIQVASSATIAGANFKPMVVGMNYNEQQRSAIDLAIKGRGFCLVGAAGTGKTTTTKEVISQLVRLPHVQPFPKSTEYITQGTPGILVCSFTNKAVNNIKRQLPDELKRHCLTIHKLLEYAPERDITGKIIGFAPKYNRGNKLPWISALIIEESSMVGTDLFQEVLDALPEGCHPQMIFLGDLNQLPPVFGYSILGFKLLELPVVELTEVYRQALLSPIITLAHRVREGRGFPADWEFNDRKQCIVDRGEHGIVKLFGWNKRVQVLGATKTMGHQFCTMIEKGEYDPGEDIILCPQNVNFGQIELNKIIADYLGRKRGSTVWEVLARGKYSYFAVGDKVMYNHREAIIKEIKPAPGYAGRITADPCTEMDRWGKYRDGRRPQDQILDPIAAMDLFESTMHDGVEKNSASHEIKLEYTDTGDVQSISASGDINNLQFGYVITVHKSQGSEWRRVIIALHYTHAAMLSRELMYTAITRARHELVIFFDPGKDGGMDSVKKAAVSPEIKGITLQQKAEYFKGKRPEYQRKQFNAEAASNQDNGH